MYRGTRKLVPLFYNTILQNAKEWAQSQVYLSYAERRSISMMEHQNAKEREQNKLAWAMPSDVAFQLWKSKCKNAKMQNVS